MTMNFFRDKRIILLPTMLTAAMLTLIFLFRDTFTAPRIALMYWVFGSIIIFNITKILRIELKHKSLLVEDLEKQKLYLENLIDSAPEGIVWADQDCNIKYVNRKYTEIFGYTNEEAQGANVDELLNPGSGISEAQKITESVSKGVSQQSEGIRFCKDGSQIYVSIVGAPMKSWKGNLEVFGIYRDITKEKEAEKKLVDSEKSLRNLSDQLLDANNFKELLLDIITHDLKNPAGVISGALELLEDDTTNSEILDVVRSSTANLFEVIDSASTLSKLSVGEKINLERMDIVPLLKEVATTFNSQLTSAQMTLKIDLPDSIILSANRILTEVISNYISNAIKYASESKQLVLTTSEGPDFIQIELKDEGKSIPEDKRQQIFNRRVQLLDGPKSGSGLGLAIVKRIAEAHNAVAGVIANEPHGNIFYFRINLKHQESTV